MQNEDNKFDNSLPVMLVLGIALKKLGETLYITQDDIDAVAYGKVLEGHVEDEGEFTLCFKYQELGAH